MHQTSSSYPHIPSFTQKLVCTTQYIHPFHFNVFHIGTSNFYFFEPHYYVVKQSMQSTSESLQWFNLLSLLLSRYLKLPLLVAKHTTKQQVSINTRLHIIMLCVILDGNVTN